MSNWSGESIGADLVTSQSRWIDHLHSSGRGGAARITGGPVATIAEHRSGRRDLIRPLSSLANQKANDSKLLALRQTVLRTKVIKASRLSMQSLVPASMGPAPRVQRRRVQGRMALEPGSGRFLYFGYPGRTGAAADRVALRWRWPTSATLSRCKEDQMPTGAQKSAILVGVDGSPASEAAVRWPRTRPRCACCRSPSSMWWHPP